MTQWSIKITHTQSFFHCKDEESKKVKRVVKRLIKGQVISHKASGIDKKRSNKKLTE